MSVIDITDANFDEVVLGSALPFVLKLGADWCSPCRQLAPIIEKLAIEYDGKANVGVMDVDNSPLVSARYGVRSVPAVFIFKNGGVSKKLVGMTTREKLIEIMDIGQ